WLEESGAADPMVLAEHFWRGNEPLRAAPWYRQAAEQALKAHDLAGAIARSNLGLAALAGGAKDDPAASRTRNDNPGALLLLQAEAYLWRGEVLRAEELGSAALGLLPPGSERWLRAASHTIVALGKQGVLDRLQALVDRVRRTRSEPAARDALVMCLGTA